MGQISGHIRFVVEQNKRKAGHGQSPRAVVHKFLVFPCGHKCHICFRKQEQSRRSFEIDT